VIGGHGPPLVLIHGWPETWYEWRHVLPALAKNYTVIAPDLRGLGDSSKPLIGYDGKSTVEVIHQLVSNLCFKHIFLVGYDDVSCRIKPQYDTVKYLFFCESSSSNIQNYTTTIYTEFLSSSSSCTFN